MDVELQLLPVAPYTDNATGDGEEVTPGNGTCSNHNTASNTENSHLLRAVQVDGTCRNICAEDDSAYAVSGRQPCMRWRELARMKRELNKEVVWKLKLWMVILTVVIFIAVIILISVLLCAVHHEDEDEKYDRSSFVVPRSFSGNFTVPKQSFMPDAPSQSPAVGMLSGRLRQKMTDVYNNSSALKRYFSHAEINTLRNGSVEYKLAFLMPEDHLLLTRYTLSREVVYNVLLQQLLDQDTKDPLYIEPSSLRMQVAI